MFEQDRTFRQAVSDKFKARIMGIKEKFTPLNIVRMLTGSGTIGKSIRTKVGRSMGYSERDIQYFGGYKRKRSIYGPDRTRVPSGSKAPVKVNDSTADILAKIYNLMRKIDEENTKRYEKEQNFTEENQFEDKKRHEKVLKALGAKGKTTAELEKEKPKEETDEKGGILNKIFFSIFGAFKKVFSFFKLVGEALVSILTIGGLIKTLSVIGEIFKTPVKLLSNIFISILPVVANLLWRVFRNPIKLLAAGVVASIIGLQDSDSAKEFDLKSAETALPGLVFQHKDKDTGENTYQTIGKGRPESLIQFLEDKTENTTGFSDEAFYKLKYGHKNIYQVPLIGSYGQTTRLALSEQEAFDLSVAYQKYRELFNKYREIEKQGDERKKNSILKELKLHETNINDVLMKHLNGTYKDPMKSEGSAFGFVAGRSRFLVAADRMVEGIFGISLDEIRGSIETAVGSSLKSFGIDTDKIRKDLKDTSESINKLQPIIDSLKGSLNIMEYDEVKDLEKMIEKQKDSVMKINQTTPTEQKIDIGAVSMRDTKLNSSSYGNISFA